MKTSIVILAAGEGKRMHSELPKTLHTIGGKPMLEHVVDTARTLNPEQIITVHAANKTALQQALPQSDISWVEQKEQLGTAHAVAQTIPHLSDSDRVLILYGDVPLISDTLLQNLLDITPENTLGLITAELEDPTGFGRIIRDEDDNIIAIVEHKDLAPDQIYIDEINTGIMLIPSEILKKYLPLIKNSNAQNEYYLTDIIAQAASDNNRIQSVITTIPEEVLGVNDKYQLACLERYFQSRNAQKLCEQGLQLYDPERFDLRGELNFGRDVSIDINVIVSGKVTLGNNTTVGANTTLHNVTVGNNVVILPNSVIENAILEDGCKIGPFARIRPNSTVKTNAHVGNFVELKNCTLGENSKANHLSYLGDSIIDKNVNIGAGTITCNYDGAYKHKTIIEEDVFVGSNCALVAPITIGKNVTIGAGSTVTHDAPADQLIIARAKQCSISNWKRPTKKDKEKK